MAPAGAASRTRRREPHVGLWEFPGGKVERGECDEDALRRELLEELGVHVERSAPVHVHEHAYARHGVVRIKFFVVLEWRGTPTGLERQRVRWVRIRSLYRVAGLRCSGAARWLLPSNRGAVHPVHVALLKHA